MTPRSRALVVEQLARRGIDAPADDALAALCALFKDRCTTTAELADWLAMYFADAAPSAEDVGAHVTDGGAAGARHLARQARERRVEQGRDRRGDQGNARRARLKMPQLAHAVRVLVCGRAQTPSIDAVLELFPQGNRARAFASAPESLAIIAVSLELRWLDP